MNTDKLSSRLTTVAKFVPKGSRMADIGSDHAYLPCYLAKKEIITAAIAGEVAQGPFQSAERNVQAEGLTSTISVRLGDGLEVIKPGEVDCITIAGMGGSLISSILEAGKDKLAAVKRLVLQPNIHALSIRNWFLQNGWELINEEIIEEDGKIYEVLVAEKGDPHKPYQQAEIGKGLLFGPFLLGSKEPAFLKKWNQELKNWLRIYEQLEAASSSDETEARKQEIVSKIKMAKEVLN